MPYDNLGQLRQKLIEANPLFAAVGQVAPADWSAFGSPGELGEEPFRNAIQNFYMTDPISRASEAMAECTEIFVVGKQEATGTDG